MLVLFYGCSLQPVWNVTMYAAHDSDDLEHGISSGSRSYFPLKNTGNCGSLQPHRFEVSFALHCSRRPLVSLQKTQTHTRLVVGYWPQEHPSFELHSDSNSFQKPALNTTYLFSSWD